MCSLPSEATTTFLISEHASALRRALSAARLLFSSDDHCPFVECEVFRRLLCRSRSAKILACLHQHEMIWACHSPSAKIAACATCCLLGSLVPWPLLPRLAPWTPLPALCCCGATCAIALKQSRLARLLVASDCRQCLFEQTSLPS